MCAIDWLIDWLFKVQQAIFQSYSGWGKFVNKKIIKRRLWDGSTWATKNIRDTYTTGSTRLDPGLYGFRVAHICGFFKPLCGPANCLSLYDIVFPMFWTFLWWVNCLVSGPISNGERTSVPCPLSWNIYVKKQCRHTHRARYNNVCNWLIDWLIDWVLLKNIWDAYTTDSSRLDPGLYGVRVVHICGVF
jgi:hypothetical protein